MILVDAGNTTLHFAIEKGGKLIRSFRRRREGISKRGLKKLLKTYEKESILLSSVVPEVTRLFKKMPNKVYVVGEDITVPIKCLYNKNEVGQDRLVNAFAAKILYPRAKIIIDFGTAITIDFLSRDGSYLGGFILPGINLYLSALTRCALLPDKINLTKGGRGIPKTTQDSISAGVKEGFIFMINGFINKYKPQLQRQQRRTLEVIITGGESPLIIKKVKFTHHYVPLLTLMGLALLKKRYNLT